MENWGDGIPSRRLIPRALRACLYTENSMPLPATERILLGPGPSLIPPRVIGALAAPVLSHLDPDFVPLLDDVRASLRRVFRADDKALTLATPGTGTSAMEAAVANVVTEGTRAVVIVSGYFGDRLVQIVERYGGRVRRIDVEWGRAADPQRLRDELRREGAAVYDSLLAHVCCPGRRVRHAGREREIPRQPDGIRE